MVSLLKNVATIRITTPIELIQAGEALHGSTCWKLESTLERDAERFGVMSKSLLKSEQTMLNLFKERAHLYDQNFVEPQSAFEWYSLIRHYGGPSRLFDVTSSYLVAAFFALNNSPRNTDAVVWAFKGCSTSDSKDLDDLLNNKAMQTEKVLIAKPDRLNVRINAQSGCFFVPGSVEVSLKQQISKTFETDIDIIDHDYSKIDEFENAVIKHKIFKLVIPHENHSNLFRFLSRCNVRAYSLYPGIEGLAASLQEMMRVFD